MDENMRLSRLEEQIKVLPRMQTDIAVISEQIKEIKDNHLHDLKDGQRELNKKFDDQKKDFDGRFSATDTRLDNVCITLAEQKPQNKIFWSVVEKIILIVVVGIMALIFKNTGA